MHFCTAHVAIGGDTRNIMYRDEFAPVSWPEVEVLRESTAATPSPKSIPFVDVQQTAACRAPAAADDLRRRGPGARVWGGKNPPPELERARRQAEARHRLDEPAFRPDREDHGQRLRALHHPAGEADGRRDRRQLRRPRRSRSAGNEPKSEYYRRRRRRRPRSGRRRAVARHRRPGQEEVAMLTAAASGDGQEPARRVRPFACRSRRASTRWRRLNTFWRAPRKNSGSPLSGRN